MSFQSPFALLGLLAVPALIGINVLAERRRTRLAARFSNPSLLPNVIDRSPGRRRYLPFAILLAGLAGLIVGVARPHATITVKREEATVVLAIDTSRSMRANDVAPTRLQAARGAATAFLARVPKKFRVGIISIGTRATVALPPTSDRDLAAAAIAHLRSSEGTALGDAVLLATRMSRNERASDGSAPPTAVLLISDGANQGGTTTPAAAAQKARLAHIPVTTVLVGTPDGQVERTLTGGYREIIRVPANPATLRQVARATGGQFFTATTDAGLREVYERLGSRLGHRSESREITDVFGGASAALVLVGGAFSATLVQEDPCPVKAIALATALVAAALAVGTTPALAKTSECNGLQTCVPVAGPWVVVPVAGGASRPHVDYQLSCPAGFIVGGIDIELSDRAIDVGFLGRSGSPVNPGITTERAAVFLATYVGTGAPVASFRPHLGCIPASGGGARVPTAVGLSPLGTPVVRRSRDVRLRPGRQEVIGQGCAANERLVGSWGAVGFYTSKLPTLPLARAVTLGAGQVRGGKVRYVVSASEALHGVRAVVQVGAVCAGGT